MPKECPYQVGDWVAFMSHSIVVYGKVEYIIDDIAATRLVTTAGMVNVDSVLEFRRR